MSKLNQEALADLRDIMEEEFAPLLTLYIKDADTRFEELNAQLQPIDCEAIRHTVHSFKGASSNVCAVELSRQAQCIEDAAKEHKSDGLAAAINALYTEYKSVRAELQLEIKNSSN